MATATARRYEFMILLIDNYDSFVYNLARYFWRLGQETQIVRNDELAPEDMWTLNPTAIVISPGPCAPQQAGNSLDIIRQFHTQYPIFGVCLGHQAIAEAFGGRIVRAPEPVHGRTSEVFHTGSPLFAEVPNPFRANRYHSLVAEEESLPACLNVTARTLDGVIMALEHKLYPVVGVQFHPESILTDAGFTVLTNFLKLAAIPVSGKRVTIADERIDPPRIEHRADVPVTF